MHSKRHPFAPAIAVASTMLFADASFSLLSILVDPFVVGGGAGALVELLPQVKRWLTPLAVRHRMVSRGADATIASLIADVVSSRQFQYRRDREEPRTPAPPAEQSAGLAKTNNSNQEGGL